MKTIKGNLITLAKGGVFDIIVHGCNCFCVMGAGIAPQIANAFRCDTGPEEIDNTTNAGDENKLGTCSYAKWAGEDGHEVVIVNGYTQFGTSAKPRDDVLDYAALRAVFQKVAGLTQFLGLEREAYRIGYPAIGAGLAGGDWEVISYIIDEELEGLDHTLVEWDGS